MPSSAAVEPRGLHITLVSCSHTDTMLLLLRTFLHTNSASRVPLATLTMVAPAPVDRGYSDVLVLLLLLAATALVQ
jgi:hypothetical protein